MIDPVLESYLKDFAKDYKKDHLDQPAQFEHFVNYCVMAKHYVEAFEPDTVSIGGNGDLGIDGVGIFINDHLCLTPTDVDYFRKSLRRLDVEFVFVQSKTSSRFDVAEIGSFLSGVRHFFSKELPVAASPEIREIAKLKDYVYSLTIDMDHPPICHLYYATTGAWKDDKALLDRVSQGKADLVGTHLFDAVNFVALDAERIKKIYREIKNKIVREILFEKHTILPDINGIAEAYIGVVPAKEYLKILCDDDGILNRRLFYDNVRDFQGHNPVNSEMESTASEASQQDRFVLLNNGVTVVAKDVQKVGSRFRLRDYQVVNGCQTSHVLYFSKNKINNKVFLPFKLIVTDNVEVTNQIIQGTNRQTEIKPEAFESLAPFQKELEEMYLAVSSNLREKIYYERRSKQYDDITASRDHVVTLPGQIKSFVGMFLNEPHSTHRYYGELLDSYRTRIFNESHRLMPYVTAGVALATMERLFSEDALPKSLRSYRHQLLMVFRLKYGQGDMPPLNAKGMDEYCARLLSIVNVDEDYKVALVEAGRIVEETRVTGMPWREPPERTRSFTGALLSAVGGGTTIRPAIESRISGKVDQFSPTRGFGFIRSTDVSKRVFFHQNDVRPGDAALLDKNPRVEFTLIDAPKGPKATNIVVK